MDGCQDCKGQVICVKCDESNKYFLIQDVCAKINIEDFIITYDHNGHIIMQYDYNDILPEKFDLTVEIDRILPDYPDVIPSPLPI